MRALRATLANDSATVRGGLLVSGGLLLLAVSAEALMPRPDWHGAPIRLFPLRFRYTVFNGALGDKLAHLAFGITIMVLLGAALAPSRRLHWQPRLAAGLVAWSLGIELIQGVLPYRNAELLDGLAGMTGVVLGFALARLRQRWFAPVDGATG